MKILCQLKHKIKQKGIRGRAGTSTLASSGPRPAPHFSPGQSMQSGGHTSLGRRLCFPRCRGQSLLPHPSLWLVGSAACGSEQKQPLPPCEGALTTDTGPRPAIHTPVPELGRGVFVEAGLDNPYPSSRQVLLGPRCEEARAYSRTTGSLSPVPKLITLDSSNQGGH